MMTLLILNDLENIEVALYLILTLQFTQKLHQVNIFNLPTAVKGQCDVCWHSGHFMKATEKACYALLTDFNQLSYFSPDPALILSTMRFAF